MKKSHVLALGFALLMPLMGWADTEEAADLVLPEARHLALFDRFICRQFDEGGVAMPTELETRGIRIEKLIGDRMVIDFLVAATFEEKGASCRYSAILSRGVVRRAMVLVKSKAFATNGDGDCAEGKAVLDRLFAKVSFSHTLKPLNYVAIHIPSEDAVRLCGEGSKTVRVVFRRDRSVRSPR